MSQITTATIAMAIAPPTTIPTPHIQHIITSGSKIRRCCSSLTLSEIGFSSARDLLLSQRFACADGPARGAMLAPVKLSGHEDTPAARNARAAGYRGYTLVSCGLRNAAV